MIDPHPTGCNICGGEVEFIDNSKIYGRSLGSGKAYRCRRCGAYVGTHKNKPDKAMGLLADERMRLAKRYCHELFDGFWHTGPQRTAAYRRLANDLGIEVSECHFGYFDLPQLRRAYFAVKKWRKGK